MVSREELMEMEHKATVRELVERAEKYYRGFKAFEKDSQLEPILRDRLEEILIDLVCCFETTEMYEWERYLFHFGFTKEADGEDYVSEILGDVAKLMGESE